ncbi:hypothetical protein EXIGLDRAFT_834727 [Exidia glandulosa HHB12029]|uniref:Concanavalin A-like lectin/glucanase n=1 Tax=Exidia glandulosa HHB12029 TaxID=1314781 RepID=A0A165JIS3_EXIGL|nr:hypothetical protein EXIGLDRAFT_834727 [Exidia glandulosa HHB12029]
MRGFLSSTFILALAASAAYAKLLIDYHGGDDPKNLGAIELESFNLGDHVAAGSGGSDVFIKAETDTTLNRPALHYKRSEHYRRAEMRILDHDIEEDKTYYVGFTFRLSHSRKGLVFFQWKKADKTAAPQQNIPFHMEFEGEDELTLGYTTPGGNGSQREPVWHGKFSTGNSESDVHSVGFAINTANDGSGWLEFYLDGKKQTFDNGKDRLENVYLLTGRTYPKIGIYRGEAAQGDESNAADHTFNSYVYRVQISDSSLDEIAEAAGLDGGSTPEPSSTTMPPETMMPPSTSQEPVPTETPSPPPPSKPTCSKNKKRSRSRLHRIHSAK